MLLLAVYPALLQNAYTFAKNVLKYEVTCLAYREIVLMISVLSFCRRKWAAIWCLKLILWLNVLFTREGTLTTTVVALLEVHANSKGRCTQVLRNSFVAILVLPTNKCLKMSMQNFTFLFLEFSFTLRLN